MGGSCQNTIGYKTKNQAQDQRADNLVAAINSWLSDPQFDANNFWGPLFSAFLRRSSEESNGMERKEETKSRYVVDVVPSSNAQQQRHQRLSRISEVGNLRRRW